MVRRQDNKASIAAHLPNPQSQIKSRLRSLMDRSGGSVPTGKPNRAFKGTIQAMDELRQGNQTSSRHTARTLTSRLAYQVISQPASSWESGKVPSSQREEDKLREAHSMRRYVQYMFDLQMAAANCRGRCDNDAKPDFIVVKAMPLNGVLDYLSRYVTRDGGMT